MITEERRFALFAEEKLCLRLLKTPAKAKEFHEESLAEIAAAVAPPPASEEPKRVERECPFCAELILARAKVCKHCGRDVEPDLLLEIRSELDDSEV